MIRFNIERIILLRGYKNPLAFLRQQGFTYRVIQYMLATPATLKIEYINKLCVALRCTPNDLMEWQPSDEHPLDADHPLNKLVRQGAEAAMRGAIRSIPPDKLDRALELLKKLSEEG